MTKFTGEIFKTASDTLSYEIDGAGFALVMPFAEIIEKEFGFQVDAGMPVIGFDEAVVTMTKDQIKIWVGWDIWSGLYVFAHNKEGDQTIKDIADHVNPKLSELETLEQKLSEEYEKKKDEL